MTRLLLIRHAESTANIGDVSFGNIGAPLTEKAINNQIPNTRKELIEKYGINPMDYQKTVVASEYNRTYQTALALGFLAIDRCSLLNESEIYNSGELFGVDVIKKHIQGNGWLPEQEIRRAQKIIENIQDGTLDYEIVFSHGMIIAAIVSELEKLGLIHTSFDMKRGYVPLQAQIVPIEISIKSKYHIN